MVLRRRTFAARVIPKGLQPLAGGRAAHHRYAAEQSRTIVLNRFDRIEDHPSDWGQSLYSSPFLPKSDGKRIVLVCPLITRIDARNGVEMSCVPCLQLQLELIPTDRLQYVFPATLVWFSGYPIELFRVGCGSTLRFGHVYYQRYNGGKEIIMTEAATRLIRDFSSLPADERYAVLIELARLSEIDAPMTEEDYSRAGNEIFAMYDDEEAELGDSKEG